RRRVVTGLTVVALVLVGIGLAAMVFDAGLVGAGGVGTGGAGTTVSRSNSPQSSASPTASQSGPVGSGIPGTPPPIGTPSPNVSAGSTSRLTGFVQQGTGFVYYAGDGSVIPVKPVPGLEVHVEAGRATYWALSSNKYGLKTGSYAGEFMPLVTMGQADGSSAATGGMVLAGTVVARLISDKLASIPSDTDRWIVALPVDIRASSTSTVDVSFDRFGLAGWSNTPRVIIRYAGSLPVVEANPTNGGFHVLVEALGVTAWQVIDPIRLSLPPGVIDPAHAMNQLLVYGNGTTNVQRDVLYDRPAAVGQVMLTAANDVSVSLVVNGSRADLGPDKVLAIGDVPVFVAQA
ncbi:MAG: hypothetical protein ABSB75_08970, partial [Candidatus Limnocylindrales bacterium]